MTMRFSVRLPCGLVRPFADAAVFNAYVEQWPDAEFLKIWPLPYCCLITRRTFAVTP